MKFKKRDIVTILNMINVVLLITFIIIVSINMGVIRLVSNVEQSPPLAKDNVNVVCIGGYKAVIINGEYATHTNGFQLIDVNGNGIECDVESSKDVVSDYEE